MSAEAQQSRPALIKEPKQLGWFEKTLVLIAFIVLWQVLKRYVHAAPNSSDLLYYFEIGLKRLRDPFVLNRYFHIYLQKFFIELAPSPLLGLQNLWAFLMALTTVLVYSGARLVRRESSILTGLIAAAIFLALPAIGDITGVLYVDVTAMAMTALVLTLYFASLGFTNGKQALLLGLLGLVLALAYRTKETTLPSAVLLLGLFFEGNAFQFKPGLRKLLWVLLGVILGILLMGLFNHLVLKDFFFGLRLSDYSEYFNTYVDRAIVDLDARTYEDWYRFFFLGSHQLAFLLYIISGIRAVKQLSFDRRIAWLAPLACIFFVIVSIGNRYTYETRFVLPVLPGVAMLAPQFLVELDGKKKSVAQYAFAALSVLLALGVVLGVKAWGDAQGLETALFFSQFVNSILLTLLLAALFTVDRQRWGQFILLGLLAANLVRPLGSNLLTLFRNQYNYQIFQSSTSPFATFKGAIRPDPEMRFFIQDAAMPTDYLSITKNRAELQALFDLYFDTNLKRDNFVFFTEGTSPIPTLLDGPAYDQALIRSEELQDSQLNAEQKTMLEQRYILQPSPQGDLLLLTRR